MALVNNRQKRTTANIMLTEAKRKRAMALITARGDKTMINTTIKTTVLEVSDKTTKRTMTVEVSGGKVKFCNERGGKEFIFETGNHPVTYKRWREVVRLLSAAITAAEKQTNTNWPMQTVKR